MTPETGEMIRGCGAERNCKRWGEISGYKCCEGGKRNTGGRALSGKGGGQYGGRVIEEE